MMKNLMVIVMSLSQMPHVFARHSLMLWRDVYYFFHSDLNKKQRYHFARYCLWSVQLFAVMIVLAGIITITFSDQSIVYVFLYIIPAVFFLAMGGVPAAMETKWEPSGTWLAWYPGLGYKAKDGSFKPMPWPSFISKLPQLGPLSAVRKTVELNAKNAKREEAGQLNKADQPVVQTFLPPAEHFQFALGAANVGETVLRGTRILDGYSYRQNLEQAARARGDGGLSGGLLTVGAVPWDYPSEPQHFAITGKSGSGKSVAINTMLKTVRGWRNNSALIADPAGGYLARFGRDSDYLLNPFDLRSEDWSPFAEMEFDYDAAIIANSTIPEGSGSSGEWNHYARTLLTEVLKALWLEGEKNASRVLYYCATADRDELADLLTGTPAAALCSADNEKMLGSVRGIISTYMGSWIYLKDGGTFSVRKFVRESDNSNGAWLFMPYTDSQMGMLKYLISTWMDLSIIEGLSMTESNTRRLWVVLDELDSLGKISSLKAGLTKLRKYGVCCICGIQTVAQLRATYGRDDAQTLLSCLASKLTLSPGDSETAEFMSKEIGDQEVERMHTSSGTSRQAMEFLDNKSTNQHMDRKVGSAVLPAQLLGLPNLHGYLRMPGADVLQVVLPYVSIPEQNKPFEAAIR